MIEKVILDFLSKNLDVPVYLEQPPKMPERYVLFEKTSGGKRNHLKSSTFAFQSYANSMYESAKLNEEVKRVVEQLVTLDRFGGIYLNSDYNFTDIQIKKYRYQAVYDINYY